VPSVGELAQELGINVGEVNLLLSVERDAELLEDMPKEEGVRKVSAGRPGRSNPTPVAEAERLELVGLIEEGLKFLDPRARDILGQRFGLDGKARDTLRELGEKYGITRERVRQIEATALDRLSRGKLAKTLSEYAED
jgi:RNA polymerase primary sigma factor